MGVKLSWTGLALFAIGTAFVWPTGVAVAGAIILAIGVVLQWLDK